ncbi:MAG: molybdopterin-dependent oxidoreductase [Burkholderiales bacterium]|nr:molybdopterin-dependent oxidoreductase [Burkholderiales bacterium]
MNDTGVGISLELTVNGRRHELATKPGQTLLDVLRDELNLTGTKRGCEDGTCGTCVVTVNGAMARACRVPVARADGKEVVTIEGLAANGELHPLQQAFIDTGAVQCGFCTPGAIMASKALLDRNPGPTRPQIAKALGSNLCRCTGYVAILDAVARVAGPARGATAASPLPAADLRPHEAADARDKVTGAAIYAADLAMTGMLHAAVLRSPHPHADILGIDAAAARALPEVVAVVTASDVPGLNRYGRALKDQRVLADGRVRQIGDAVAAVAATSAEAARGALSLIRVDYRPLPAVTDPASALGEGAPLVHEGGNLLDERKLEWGDARAGLARADVVVDETYTTQFCEHAYLEPESVVAYEDAEGRLVVRSATQYPHLHRRAVAETMGLAPDRVRILPTVIGGGFGGKTDISCECVAALLALATRRPVKIVYTRAESFAATTKRHPFRIRCRTGVTRDGRLTALAAEVLADTGAYASAGPGILVRAFVSLVGPYRFPAASVHGQVVYTNNTLAGAMRGFGGPQMAFAIESQMDAMAARLGIDPLEFRSLNRRSTPSAAATPQDVEQEAAYKATLDAVRPYYEEALRVREASNATNGRIRRGVGIASMRYGIGYASHQPPTVSLELGPEGRALLFTGAMDMGQGTDAALGLIVAGELALPPASVTVVSGDTTATPDTGASTGSRVIYTEGNAVREAAVRVRDAILTTASGMLDVSYEKLELRDGRVAPRPETGIPGPGVSLEEVVRSRQVAGLPLRFDGQFRPVPLKDSLSGHPSPFLVHVTATHMVEVEVDLRQGEVRILRVVAAHDVGRVVYPQGLKGQIDGAVSMGLGYALKEEFHPGVTTSFKDYRIPTARETPEIVQHMIEMGDPSAGLGAKGASECATVAVAPAIINAIANATGCRVRELPATPERLLAAMAAAPRRG